VFTLKIYFDSRSPQILLTSERGRRSIIAFMRNILQVLAKKNGTVNIFMQKKLLQREKAKISQNAK